MHRQFLLVLIFLISYITSTMPKVEIIKNTASAAFAVSLSQYMTDEPLGLEDDRILKIFKILLKTGTFYKSVLTYPNSTNRRHVFLIRSDPNMKKIMKLDCNATILSGHRTRLEKKQSAFHNNLAAALSLLTKKNYERDGFPGILHMINYHEVLILMLEKTEFKNQAHVLRAEWKTLLAEHQALNNTLVDVFSQIGKRSLWLDEHISVKNSRVQLRYVEERRFGGSKAKKHLMLYTAPYSPRTSLQHPSADPEALERTKTTLNELFNVIPKKMESFWRSDYLRAQMQLNMDPLAFEKFELWRAGLLHAIDRKERVEEILDSQISATNLKEYHFLYSQYMESSAEFEFLKQWEDTCKKHKVSGLKLRPA